MQNNKDNFTGKMFRRLWIPAMVSSFGWALSDMADAVVVGQKLGGVGLAAISLILPVYMINCVFAHGLGLGGSVKFSQLMGEGKEDEAKRCFGGIFWLAVILSLATALLGNVFMEGLLRILGTKAADGELYTATKGYLRILVSATPLFYMSNIFNYFLNNNESQKLGGLGSVTGNVIDISMNVVFVIFMNLGAPGAALATVVGQVVAISIYLPGFFKKTGSLKFSLPNLTDIKNAFAPLKAGLATMTVEEISMAILKMGFGGRTDGYIQITSIVTEDGTLELHMRDDATSFNPFDLSTNRASVGGDFDMDSMGVLVIKKRAREFFYRRYQGFNTLIIKI